MALQLFGTDGIRGKAGKYPLTPDICRKLASALASQYCNGNNPCVLIGRDTRYSGTMFECIIAAELASHGIDVQLLGVVPTPALAFITQRSNVSVGIMITASHNPYYDNGIKLFNNSGMKLDLHEEEQLEKAIFSTPQIADEILEIANIKHSQDLLSIYTTHLTNLFSSLENANLKLVVDCANGAFSYIAPSVLEKLGFDVIAINNQPNGYNINEQCGAVYPQALQAAVKKYEADIGIAFDGDGDRVILMDETGNMVDGDQILAMLTTQGPVVSTIMANSALEHYLNTKGISLIRTDVGDKNIAKYMHMHQEAILGGEPSGHIIMKEHSMCGDGLYVALAVIQRYCATKPQKFSFFSRVFEPYPRVSKNIAVQDKSVLQNPKFQAELDNAKTVLGPNGRIIVRPSGTEPLIRIMAEGRDLQTLETVASRLEKLLLEAI